MFHLNRCYPMCLMILKNKREHTEKDPVLARRLIDTILNMLEL